MLEEGGGSVPNKVIKPGALCPLGDGHMIAHDESDKAWAFVSLHSTYASRVETATTQHHYEKRAMNLLRFVSESFSIPDGHGRWTLSSSSSSLLLLTMSFISEFGAEIMYVNSQHYTSLFFFVKIDLQIVKLLGSCFQFDMLYHLSIFWIQYGRGQRKWSLPKPTVANFEQIIFIFRWNKI